MAFKKTGLIQVAAEYCPEAIEEWYSIASNNRRKRNRRSDLSLRAKKHLSALGWVFWYVPKGNGRELRYKSPTGQSFYSLKTACKSCIADDGGKVTKLGFLPHQESSDSLEQYDIANRSSETTVPLGARRVSVSGSWTGQNKLLSESKKRKRKGGRLGNCVNDNELEIEGRRGKDGKNMEKMSNKEKTNKRRRMEEEQDLDDPADDDEAVIKPVKGKSMSKLIKLRDLKRKASQRPRRSSKRLRSISCNLNNNDLNDDFCSVCHSGGELVLCGGCPLAFHSQCLCLTGVPDEEFWFCPSCRCGICGTSETKVESFMICDQCQQRFHVGCLRREIVVVDACWFCSSKCEQVYFSLQNIVGKEIKIKDHNLFWTMLKPPDDHYIRVNHRAKLCRAVEVFHESFEPSEDPLTGRDLVEDVVFGRKSELNHTNFLGFYTVVLGRKKELISVATVRIFRDLAEVPLVATGFKHRKKGMCRVLMNELEKQMVEIGVEKLVLPAVPNLLDYWTGQFGFSKMEDSERLKLLHHSFLDFQDTVMCHKVLMKRPDSDKSTLTQVLQ